MIFFDNVHKVLLGKKVLRGVSFSIKPGEALSIVGCSGAGKSVTLKHMVKLMSPDSGSIQIDGKNIEKFNASETLKYRSRFGMLFQGSALLQSLSVYDNIALPLRNRSYKSEEEIKVLVEQRLEWVGLLDIADQYPSELSGGMQKRVGLARATIMNPEIILYDEPTSGLDPVISRKIDHLIVKLNKEMNATSVIVSHDLLSALSIGTKILMLHHGQVIECCTPQEFIISHVPEVQEFLKAQKII